MASIRPYIASFVDNIKMWLKKCQEEAFKENEPTSEEMWYIQHEISYYVRHLFPEYLLDFYAKPEYLRKQIEQFCKNIPINNKVSTGVFISFALRRYECN